MNLIYKAIEEDDHWGPLYRGLKTGSVAHKQIEDEVRSLHITEYTQMCRQWMEGTLFRFQKASFDYWLDCDKETFEAEELTAKRYLEFECGCQVGKNQDVWEFITRRIWKFGMDRRKNISENHERRETCRDFWRKENIKYKWEWRND